MRLVLVSYTGVFCKELSKEAVTRMALEVQGVGGNKISEWVVLSRYLSTLAQYGRLSNWKVQATANQAADWPFATEIQGFVGGLAAVTGQFARYNCLLDLQLHLSATSEALELAVVRTNSTSGLHLSHRWPLSAPNKSPVGCPSDFEWPHIGIIPSRRPSRYNGL